MTESEIVKYIEKGEIMRMMRCLGDDTKLLIVMDNNPELFTLPVDRKIFKYAMLNDFPEVFMHIFNKLQLYMKPHIYSDLLTQIIERNIRKERKKIHFLYQTNVMKLIIERGNISFSVKAPFIYDIVLYPCTIEVFEFYIRRCSLYDPIEILKRTSNLPIAKYILKNNIKPKYFDFTESEQFIRYSRRSSFDNFYRKIKIMIIYGFRFNISAFLINCKKYELIKLIMSEPNKGNYKMPSYMYDLLYKRCPYELFKKVIKLNFL